jgi:SNF2 family DNA or RNA helicase
VIKITELKLFPHQEKALQTTKDKNRVAYYLDMGLGKTFVGSEKVKELGNKMNLLVCQKSKIDDWINHFKTYYSDYDICDLTSKNGMKSFMSCDSMVQSGRFKIIGVINYELAWRRPQLLKLSDYTLMLDESSLIQNDSTKQTKFILQLNPENVILLSGTPTSGKYENLLTQMSLLGWSISKELYNKQYVNWTKIDVGGFPLKIVDKEDPYKNVDRLKQKLRNHGAVFMKTEEAFELPEQIVVPMMIKTSKEYKKFDRKSYIVFDTCNLHEFKDDSDFEGNDITPRIELIGDTTFTKRLYSRQLCGQYSKDKLEAFEDLASSTQDRLIVFYNFNDELASLSKIAKKLEREVSFVNGSGRSMYGYEYIDNSITFVQYQAGAMGLNLQKANKIIYFTLPERSELFEQSKKRIHRIGQEKTCFYYLMICKDSVEEDIYENLKMRRDYTDELFKEYEEKA